jgi:hypothetical protein
MVGHVVEDFRRGQAISAQLEFDGTHDTLD